MKYIEISEYMKISPDYRGEWTRATAEMQGQPSLAGLRNMMDMDDDGSTCLLTEGQSFVIVPDGDKRAMLKHYKTAWCPLYKLFVAIVKIRDDGSGRPIIHAIPQDHKEEHLYRMEELEKFCM
jgi:hypothetical protein